jgi:hypothetical protein
MLSMNQELLTIARRRRGRPAAAPPRRVAGAPSARPLVRRLVLAGLLVLALVALAAGGQGLSWLTGLLAGAGVGAFVVLRSVRARDVTGPGPLVQRLTADALGGLGDDGWRCRHDVVTADGVYDHLAVGPGGIVLLQSLAADGPVFMHADEPVVEVVDELGRRRVHRLRPRAHADAAALRETIARVTGQRVWVQSVVVFWSSFEAGCVVDGRSVYIHGSRLGEWMRRRPHQLSQAQIDGVLEDVESLAARRDELIALAV